MNIYGDINIRTSLVNTINFLVKAKINTISGRSMDVNAAHTIHYRKTAIEKISGLDPSFYLKKEADNTYKIEVFGKNGEPRSGVLLKIRLKHLFKPTMVEITLKTDINGIIKLGELRYIRTLELSSTTITKNWNLRDDVRSILPTSVCIAENKGFKLACNTNFENFSYSLYSTGRYK
jgi:hypothetical protein